MPPVRLLGALIGLVIGVKLVSPRGTSTVSAPQSRPWLQAAGEA